MARQDVDVTDQRSPDPTTQNGAKRLPPGRPVSLPPVPTSPRYSIGDLQEQTGFNGRTIRYYITEGLLTPAHGRGPTATYDKDHLLRLRMIKELKEEFLPLETIKQKLGELKTEDLEAHFAIQTGPVEGRWRRIVFGPELELHVREREQRDYRFERVVEQIVQYARYVLDTDEESR
jgi:DNA-binding transcriptional MerR regulator